MWEKLGLIFNETHAQLPTSINIENFIRIYYSCKEDNISYINFIDIDNNLKLIRKSNAPVLEKGIPGTFDDCGVMPSSILRYKNYFYLYYSGWSRTQEVPYTHNIGLAISKDGVNFKKLIGPIISKSVINPYLVNSPNVIINENKFQMIYSSGTQWINNQPFYNLKKAFSKNGITWNLLNKNFIGNKNEIISRSTFVKILEKEFILFCSKQTDTNYEMECLIKNQRTKNAEFIIKKSSGNEWDSEMICYPNFISFRNKNLIFYNGNGYGKTGIGCALWK